MYQADKITSIKGIESYGDVFYAMKDFPEQEILKIRILEQNFVINRLKSAFCETWY